jgi:lipopolysaccharide export LptBFGC system permease protein LptF
MDIQMPGINGIDAMKEIKRNNPSIIFIVLSAYDRFMYAKEAISLGVLEYLNKPFNKQGIHDVLVRAIAQIDERREQHRNDLIIKEKMDEYPIIIHADKVFQKGGDLQLSGVLIMEFNEDETLKRQIEAKAGLLSGYTLVVDHGLSYTPDGEKTENMSLMIPTKMNLKKIIQTFDKPEEISVWKLPKFIEMLQNAGFSSIKHRIHFYSVLSSVLYLLAMVLIAAMFSLSPNQRQGGNLFKACQAILFGFVLFFISKLTTAMGMSGKLPVFLAVCGPSAIMIFIAVSSLLRKEDG